VGERQRGSVKKLPLDALRQCPRPTSAYPAHPLPPLPTVDGVANHRMALVGQVDPYLVRPPGLKRDLEEIRCSPLLSYSYPSDCGASAFHHRHPLSAGGISGDRCADRYRQISKVTP